MSTPRPLGGTELKRLHRTWRRATPGRVDLLLDGVQSPFNVGAILRSAAAYRVEHVWLVPPTPLPTDAKVGKTALGTDRYLHWTASPDAPAAVAAAQASGATVVGIELADGAVPLHELAIGDHVCLALGHEDRGLSSACLAACDAVAYLPMLGRVGSLNVAAAAAVALYEVRRQAWTPPALPHPPA